MSNNILKLYQEKLDAFNENQNSLKLFQKQFNEMHKQLIDDMSTLKSEIISLKNDITESTIEAFKKDGLKTRATGLKIQVRQNLIYTQEDILPWVKENMPIAVKEQVDTKMFEKFAKEHEVPHVKKEENIIVAFPKQLKI